MLLNRLKFQHVHLAQEFASFTFKNFLASKQAVAQSWLLYFMSSLVKT